MNAARPAVQLCWPYQSVNMAPSLANRSMLGVRYPLMPRLYAVMLNHPMSSPHRIRMLGCLVAMRRLLLASRASRSTCTVAGTPSAPTFVHPAFRTAFQPGPPLSARAMGPRAYGRRQTARDDDASA